MGTELERFTGPAAEARQALVRTIVADGGLSDPAWLAAFEEVPRHLFVPYYFVGRGHVPGGDASEGAYERLWCEDPDPVRRARWLRGAYTDGPLATRVRDGQLISSSSQPSLMARMLHELDVRDGHAVLEIGAGSGYNAALLAHRLGDDLVTTVDVDPEITESARSHLANAGYRPTVVTGDGARGCPERVPFDRIIATCTLPSVPFAWLPQCRPGARILAPLSTGLITLQVRDNSRGRIAEGRFLRTSAYFVPLRGAERMREGHIGGLPRRAIENELFRFLLTLTAGSLDPHEALSLWERERRPQRDRFGLTVAERHQWAWLDDPEGPYVWPLGRPRGQSG
ncbi:methyltransferase domain-containing protein [Streptomyces sp. NBC_00829]|uniref:methyltransferase domain-containing protein n=1 Tax=Streptomyces sp. NBC_00829 TaxID=2903679 RepID=UPI003868ACB2|nr:methyltransferase domain-containing protein [Streptomyces sp. NBC_00829]